MAARGACWRTLGTTKAGEYWRRCARGNGYSARRIRALSGLKKLGPRSEAKTRKRSRLLRPSEYKFKMRVTMGAVPS